MKGYKLPKGSTLSAEEPTMYYTPQRNIPINDLTPLQKMDIVKSGISKSYLERLKKAAGLDYNDLAAVLSVTRATLINKNAAYKFNDAVSERILSLADLYSYGYEVFGDKEHFNQWMFAQNRALGGKAPFDLMDNIFGREEVHNLIGRIEHGIFA
jgi:putative toxin-antitoxin system antitoxin component (TIGR02293 family)